MANKTHLKLKNIGIDTYKEAVIFMRKDCHICRAEGFEVHARILVTLNNKSILATLNTIADGFLKASEASLSTYAWELLNAKDGDLIEISHPIPLNSLSYVRSKIYGNVLNKKQIDNIVKDISKGFYSDIHIATFLTACANGRLSTEEITNLSSSMVEAGHKFSWSNDIVVDKHCIGGLPGNRTTPIVVSIIASLGLLMPKTSSRAITSPAGTADVMEVLAPVDLSFHQIKKVVEQENGCIVWGGSVDLSPADDILIRVERVIDLDSEGQLVASVLSKKISAGSNHVVIDIPIGPSAKIRSQASANTLKQLFEQVAKNLDLSIVIYFSEGLAPIGNGIGPALEAQDVLKVLQNKPDAPQDLLNKSITLAAQILEFSKAYPKEKALDVAKYQLQSGKAWQKFQKICEAQGGMKEIPSSKFTFTIQSNKNGIITNFDNRNLARLAKLAGAPHDKVAGIYLHAHLNDSIQIGQPLFTLHAESKGELNYAKDALANMSEIVKIQDNI